MEGTEGTTEPTTEDAFDEGPGDEAVEEAPVADAEPATEDAFDTEEEPSNEAYQNEGTPDDDYEDDGGADEEIDLGDTPDEAPPPQTGWHKVKVGYFSSKSSKAGDKKWAFVLNFQNEYGHWEHFTIGSPTGGEFAQRQLKIFARACGVADVPGEEGKLAPFKPSDLLDSILYVNLILDLEKDFPVNITAYCPETEPPTEDLVSDQSEADDGLPF